MMNAAYLAALAGYGAGLVTHLALVNDQGVEISGGPYRRKAVSWRATANGLIRPMADTTFDVPAGAVVAGWRGYSDLIGGTDYGGEDVPVERFGGQGQYTLLAKATGITHRSGS